LARACTDDTAANPTTPAKSATPRADTAVRLRRAHRRDRRAHRLGEPPVHDQRLAVLTKDHVGRLDVAV
jgi:hypothetical protein